MDTIFDLNSHTIVMICLLAVGLYLFIRVIDALYFFI